MSDNELDDIVVQKKKRKSNGHNGDNQEQHKTKKNHPKKIAQGENAEDEGPQQEQDKSKTKKHSKKIAVKQQAEDAENEDRPQQAHATKTKKRISKKQVEENTNECEIKNPKTPAQPVTSEGDEEHKNDAQAENSAVEELHNQLFATRPTDEYVVQPKIVDDFLVMQHGYPSAFMLPSKNGSVEAKPPASNAIVWWDFTGKDNLLQLLKCAQALLDCGKKESCTMEFTVCLPKGDNKKACMRTETCELIKAIYARLETKVGVAKFETRKEFSFAVSLSQFMKMVTNIEPVNSFTLFLTDAEEQYLHCTEGSDSQRQKIPLHNIDGQNEIGQAVEYKYTLNIAFADFRKMIGSAAHSQVAWARLVLVQMKSEPNLWCVIWQCVSDTLSFERKYWTLCKKTEGAIMVLAPQGETDMRLSRDAVNVIFDEQFDATKLNAVAREIACFTSIQFRVSPGKPLIIHVQLGDDDSFVMLLLCPRVTTEEDVHHKIDLLDMPA
jgi:hypothetical protein